METIFIVIVVVAILVFLFNSNIGKDPSKKTDAMLLREYRLHKKRVENTRNVGPKQYEKALKEMSILTDEMRARGLLLETDSNDKRIENEILKDKGTDSDADLSDLAEQYKKACAFAAAKDDKQAIKWLLKSAKGGNADALYMLAFSHIEGKVERNEAQCYMWFRLAANKGHEHAVKALPIIGKQFDEEQIKKGEQLAIAFERDNYA